MKEIAERISYLQGLCAGLHVNGKNQSGTIMQDILQVLADLNEVVQTNRKTIQTIQKELHDGGNRTLIITEGQESDEDIIRFTCGHCGEPIELYTWEVDEEEEDIIEIICPHCDELVFIHEGAFDYELPENDEEITDH